MLANPVPVSYADGVLKYYQPDAVKLPLRIGWHSCSENIPRI